MDLFLLTGFDSARSTFKSLTEESDRITSDSIYCNCEENEGSSSLSLVMIAMLFIKLFIFIFAVRKSWECSTGLPSYQRIFYSLMAGIFGTLYTILYLIFGSGKC